MLCLNSKQRGDATPKFRGISGRNLVNAAPSTCLVLGRGLEGIEFQNGSAADWRVLSSKTNLLSAQI
jgi:hypothetical protein